jgi:hypothetical protein
MADKRMFVHGSGPESKRTDQPAERLNLSPVSKFNHSLGISRPLSYKHNQPNHQAIEKAVFRVLQFAGEYR